MHAHHRLRHRRIELDRQFAACFAGGRMIDFARAGKMNAVQISDKFFHAVRQGVVGEGHVGEQRIAADLGHGPAFQQRAERRHRRERHIRVPLATGVARIRWRAVGVGLVGDQQQFGILRMAIERQRIVFIQCAEAAAEFNMLLARDVLITKQQNAVVEKRLVDFAEGGFAHRRGDVDVTHLRAECVRQFA